MIMQEGGDGNDGGCGADRPKKAKPNKIPQRGLGIAALEKLRREEQRSRIAATHTATGTAGSSSSEHSATGIIFNSLQYQLSPVPPFLPVLDPSSNFRPLFIRNYPLFSPALDSVQSDLRLPHVPRIQLLTIPEHQQQQVSKSLLPPPSSTGASLQIEPPSNQSYVSMNPSQRPEEQRLAGMKRSWPFHPGGTSRPPMITPATNPAQLPDSDSVLVQGRELKIPALSREDASNSTGRRRADCGRSAEAEQDGAAALDGSFLSLSSAPSPTGTDAFRQHYFLPLQPSLIQKNAPETADAMQQPSLYNFMGLPGDLIGSKTGDADVNQTLTL